MKAIRLPSIAGQGSKTSGRIAEATRRGSDATYGLLSTLGSVELLLLSALGIGQALESGARTAADNLVALSGCAFFETGAASDVSLKIENYMNDLERASMLAVSLADRAGGTLASVLETIQRNLVEKITRPIDIMRKGLRPVGRVVGLVEKVLGWLDFDIAFKVPNSIKVRFKCRRILKCRLRVKVGYYQLEFGLTDIGNVLGKVERFIKSIPLVGFLWRAVEKVVDTVLGALMPPVNLGFPSFRFLDTIADSMLGPLNALQDTVARVTSDVTDAFSMGLARFESGFEALKDYATEKLFGGLPDLFPENCTDVGCVLGPLGLANGVEILHPAWANISGLADKAARTVERLVELPSALDDTAVSAVYGFLGDMVDNWGECLQWTELPVPGVEHLAAAWGLDADDCSLPAAVTVCTQFPIPSGAVIEAASGLASNLESAGRSVFSSSRRARRRRLHESAAAQLPSTFSNQTFSNQSGSTSFDSQRVRRRADWAPSGEGDLSNASSNVNSFGRSRDLRRLSDWSIVSFERFDEGMSFAHAYTTRNPLGTWADVQWWRQRQRRPTQRVRPTLGLTNRPIQITTQVGWVHQFPLPQNGSEDAAANTSGVDCSEHDNQYHKDCYSLFADVVPIDLKSNLLTRL